MSTARLAPVLVRDHVTLHTLEVSDAAAWLAGEDDEQLKWFQMPPAAIDDVVLAIELAVEWGVAHLPITGVVAVIDVENVASRGVVEAAGFDLDGRAEGWEHSERGTMVRHLRMP